jgi:hypothetical protein
MHPNIIEFMIRFSVYKLCGAVSKKYSESLWNITRAINSMSVGPLLQLMGCEVSSLIRSTALYS